MYKHYVRLDSNNSVIKGYSTAFEDAQSGDICINTDGSRHFELAGMTNPDLYNFDRQPIYYYTGSDIVERSEADRNRLYPVPVIIPLEIRNRADIDYIAMMGGIEL